MTILERKMRGLLAIAHAYERRMIEDSRKGTVPPMPHGLLAALTHATTLLSRAIDEPTAHAPSGS